MFVLLLIILGAVSPDDLTLHTSTIKLEEFKTEAACREAEVHVTMDMQASYPGDRSFRLECRPVRNQI